MSPTLVEFTRAVPPFSITASSAAVGGPAAVQLPPTVKLLPPPVRSFHASGKGTPGPPTPYTRYVSPESEPFVSVGDAVDDDTTICVIEAMKVMNEIKAEMIGRIVEVLVVNGEPVEFGQPLFRVTRG